MMRSALVVAAACALAVLLSSCATKAELETADNAACAKIGVHPGSPDYAECRMLLQRQRIADSQERSARLMAVGRALSGAGSAAESPTNYGPSTTCFRRGESRSGLNKICYYNCVGSTVAHNVGSAELCPLTIER